MNEAILDTSNPVPPSSGLSPPPPLENGDRLSRAEFERRYNAMPELKKVELIEGEVHMPSPVRLKRHAEPHLDLVTVFGVYRHQTPRISGGDNSTLRLDMDNEVQPDAFLFIEGGDAVVDTDDYVSGAPDVIGEIAASSVSIDLGKKFNVYRRNQVKEYVVWRVLDKAIDWFVLRDAEFVQLPLVEGIYKSERLPGLWLDADALVRRDFARVHAVLQQGLASPEHKAFVEKLNSPPPAQR
ncbi:MAG: Uma2 family endonuclease [Gemmataceae bacterium]|nr:Uma2 family endonuclease [Gemmataceae bacterium]